jgi:hypothetical protein
LQDGKTFWWQRLDRGQIVLSGARADMIESEVRKRLSV